jgi:hypothetical protein
MIMEISRRKFKSEDGKDIPAFFIDARSDKAALIIHGYSSSKDEMLGMAYKIAEKGYDSYAIDLRGHGENESQLDEDVLKDVEGVVKELKRNYKFTLTLGHSLGGLLSLNSSSDFAIAVSPPLMPVVIPEAKFMLRVNSCKVVESYGEVLFRVLQKYNPPRRKDNATVFYGVGESKGIEIAIKKWAEDRDVEVIGVEEKQARLPEVEVDAKKLKAYIPNFISHLATIHAKKIEEKI